MFACSAFVKYEIVSPLYTLDLPTIVKGIIPSRGRRPARVEMFKKEVMGTWLSPGWSTRSSKNDWPSSVPLDEMSRVRLP